MPRSSSVISQSNKQRIHHIKCFLISDHSLSHATKSTCRDIYLYYFWPFGGIFLSNSDYGHFHREFYLPSAGLLYLFTCVYTMFGRHCRRLHTYCSQKPSLSTATTAGEIARYPIIKNLAVLIKPSKACLLKTFLLNSHRSLLAELSYYYSHQRPRNVKKIS